MTEKQLFKAIRGISVEYILDAAPREHRIGKRLMISLIAAACALAILASALFLPMHFSKEDPSVTDDPNAPISDPGNETTEPEAVTTEQVINNAGPIVLNELFTVDNKAQGVDPEGNTYWNGLYVAKNLEHQLNRYEKNDRNPICVLVVHRNGDDVTAHTAEDVDLFVGLGFAVREALGKMHVIGTLKQFSRISQKEDLSAYTFIGLKSNELREAFPQNYLPDDFKLDTTVTGFDCSKINFTFDDLYDQSFPANDSEVHSLMLELIEYGKARYSCVEIWIFRTDGTYTPESELSNMKYYRYKTSLLFEGLTAIAVKYENLDMQAICELSRRNDISGITIRFKLVAGYYDPIIIQ